MKKEISRELGKFVSKVGPQDLPRSVFTQSLFGITDGIAVMLAGCRQFGSSIAQILDALGGRPVATVIGLGYQTSAPLAAWSNGILSHLLDYDDLSLSMGGHPTGPVLSAALAAAEEIDADGKSLITAYAAGIEVMTKIGSALFDRLYTSGWHPTSVLGAFGACAAASNIWKLTPDQTATALAMVASAAGGIKKNFGTMTKALHVGNAAYNGVLCAMLARRGWTAQLSALEGPKGLFDLICGKSSLEDHELIHRLGNPWDIEEPGIFLKKYPCCGSIHPALDALFQISELPRPGKIERIHCKIHPDKSHILSEKTPRSGLEAKFNLRYCLASAIIRTAVSLDHFSDAAVSDPEVLSLMERIEIIPDESVGLWGSEITIECKEGRIVTGVCHKLGGIFDKMTLLRKLEDCATSILGQEKTERLKYALQNLADLPSVRDLMEKTVS
ncbi:MmgE/PrpD family protein [Thermodesulforhabdus norvegica]|uniref:2-methylcitrate dehydratase PrpD n=1 Tax=Thermodesulforhabdus norvegica TaxID=39841 RepID=A0A1I4QFT6_9BACT|nr:MmgE/PrpD family protein [Thermodesulforhabdus norvegica]SFM38877.1 2-methylcitrate dehydratase PrpD [Thermodesulforhabdus norvegica]